MARFRGLLALLGTAVAVIACAGPTPPPPPADTGGPVKPKVDRVVLFLNPPPTPETNNVKMLCCFDTGFVRPMYENLIGFEAATGKYVPQLADAWNLEPDGKTFRFKLHKGVQFHRGYGEFTAKDAKYSLEDLVRSIPNAYALASWWKDTVPSVEVINDYEVLFHLNPNSAFMEYLSEGGMMLPMRSKAQVDKEGDLGEAPAKPAAGTGVYDFLERSLGSYVRYQRPAEKHWRATPDFPQLEIRWSKEASTRLAALVAREVHITTLPDDLLPQAEAKGMKTVRGTIPGTRVWGTWVCCARTEDGKYYRDTTTPLLNVKVRQALNRAIDRSQLQKAFFARGEKMVINHMHPKWLGWDPGWEQRFNTDYAYDADGAKKLLAEAGYGPSSPLRTTISIRQSVVIPNAPDVAEAIGNFWRAAGVQVDFDQRDVAQQTTDLRAFKLSNMMYLDASATQQVSAWPNRASDLQAFPSRGAASYFDADTNAVVSKLERELDETKQAAYMKDVGDQMLKKFGSVPLFFVPVEAVVNPEFVAGWVFPGPTFGTWSHLENIKAAR